MRMQLEFNINPTEVLLNRLKRLPPTINKRAWLISQNVSSNLLERAFIDAVKSGQLNLVKELYEIAGADPAADNNAAIRKAAECGHLEIVKFLCTLPGVAPAEHNNSAIRLAVSNNHPEVVKFLSTLPGVTSSEEYISVINWAIDNNYLDMVLYLIIPTVNSGTAIIRCAENGYLDMVRFLLTLPCIDPTANNHQAIRAAHKADHSNVVNYLAELPCYNPFSYDKTFEKKKELFNLLKELHLENQIDLHRVQANTNLSFLFFSDSNFNYLYQDAKKMIIEQAVVSDNHGLTR